VRLRHADRQPVETGSRVAIDLLLLIAKSNAPELDERGKRARNERGDGEGTGRCTTDVDEVTGPAGIKGKFYVEIVGWPFIHPPSAAT